MLMTLSAIILGLLIGTVMVRVPATAENPRFPTNVTLGPVSPPPGSSFTPKYPGEFKATPPPGLNATATITATPKATVTKKATVTVKPTVVMKATKTAATVKPTTTMRYKKSNTPSAVIIPSPSVTLELKSKDAFKPTATMSASVMPVVPTVSIKPTPMKSSAVSPKATVKPATMTR